MAEVNNKKIFKKHATVLVFFQVILIALSVLLFCLRDTEIAFQNVSMLELFFVILACTIFFGIFVSGYLLNGLFKSNIVTTSFVNKINYKVLMIILSIIVIFGAVSFFIDFSLVGGEISALTWGGFILGVMGLIILGITLLIGVFLIINEVKAAL